MHAFRLCRSSYPAYDGEGARRVGGRWNSKGTCVLYMSENRSLAVLEILAHLSLALPDKYVLGVAEIPSNIPIENVNPNALPTGWMTQEEICRKSALSKPRTPSALCWTA